MSKAQKDLYDEISKLPYEKLGKVLSFVRYIGQETEQELLIEPQEELELHQLLSSGEFINSSDVLAAIKALPDD